MQFSLFSIVNKSNDTLEYLHLVIEIAGMILIPALIWFLSSIKADIEKERTENIKKLNFLTIYSNNFLLECLKMRNTILSKQKSLNEFLEKKDTNTSSNAFAFIEIPTLMYEINVQDYIFTADDFSQLVDKIFKINLKIKDLRCFINRYNQHCEIAIRKGLDEQLEVAQIMLEQISNFQYRSNILVYCLGQIGNDIETYNKNYFFQDLYNDEPFSKFKNDIWNQIS